MNLKSLKGETLHRVVYVLKQNNRGEQKNANRDVRLFYFIQFHQMNAQI